ncbi:MAG: tetratricopeptide repeat protein [Deltaproteobacteria bacterium]|nr:tetratricopeptide repeat protein [Deltaproteobacteria bacterium]
MTRTTGDIMSWRLGRVLTLACSALLLLGGCITIEQEVRPGSDPYRSLASSQRAALRQAWEALRSGRHAEAEVAARQLIAALPPPAAPSDGVTIRHPALSMAQVLLALALDGQGRSGEAEQAYGAALHADLRNHRARFNLGNHCARLNRHAEAAVQFRETVRLAPRHLAAWLELAVAEANARRFAEAEMAARRLLELDRQSADAHHVLGTVFLDQGMVAEAIPSLKSAIGLKPMRPEFHLNLARAYELVERKGEAIEEYRRFLELAPAGDPDRGNVQQLLQRLGS